MNYIKYLKNKLASITIYLATILLVVSLLLAFKVPSFVIILIAFILVTNLITIFTIEYYKKNKFYELFLSNLNELEKKYLIIETIPKPDTYEEKLIYNSIYEINKSMIESLNEYKRNVTEFKEFVEIWIHEVKIPISSLVLKCHNNKEKYDNKMLSLVRRLDNNIDEILYFVRSENTEKDFSITETNLKEVVRNVSIKNKDDLLENNINLETNIPNTNIYTDKKWLEFIINQIINNSIKYKKDKDSFIKIESHEENNKKVLEIYDNGIGIPAKDIKKVFEKSFTGSNGRNKVKSTGMGLYIIKKLCDKLGHNIYIESKEKEYTKVFIEFGKNDIYNITKL